MTPRLPLTAAVLDAPTGAGGRASTSGCSAGRRDPRMDDVRACLDPAEHPALGPRTTWRTAAPGVLLLLVGCGSPDAAGACTGAEIMLSSTTLAPGDQVHIEADRVLSDCNDTGRGQDVPADIDVGRLGRAAVEVTGP